MKTTRRQVLFGATAIGALAATAYGFSGTAKSFLTGINGKSGARGVMGKGLDPEYRVDPVTGEITMNENQRISYTMCMGCTTVCGVRVRTDKASGRVLRVTGNPYHVLSTDPHLPYKTPVAESLRGLSRFQEAGLAGRSTACGRGNAVLKKLDSPERVLTVLKRVGKRGGAQWKPIPFEQAVEEIVEGGNLFGDGHIEGLRDIYDRKTLIDPENPEFGPKSNQLVFMPPFKNGRQRFAARFAKQAFGTVNFVGHRSYCGLSMRAGYAALLDDWKKQPHLKPDFDNAEFLLFVGTAPANAGNPFKRQGHLIAKGRSENRLKFVTVDPVLTNTQSLASGNGEWLPIKPGTDSALVMGMIRWILENERYDAPFLSQPNQKAAKAAGEAAWSNATHLVIDDPDHPDAGSFLRLSRIRPGAGEKTGASAVIMDAATGEPLGADEAKAPAKLFHEGTLALPDGSSVKVATSLSLLLREAQRHSLDDYASLCNVPQGKIVDLAREFTAHGKRAAADCHGGTMHSSGFYTAYAITMLNALVGNLNRKGGTSVGGGRYREIAKGPRYDLKGFPGAGKPKGANLGRGFPYEKTSEYKRKKAQGNPYPADGAWYSLSPPLGAHFLINALEGYPYRAKALILWSSNPVYGIAGMKEAIDEKIRDPKNLPLIVSIDPFINESNRYADYIIPDRVLYESWGWAGAWGAYLTKVNTARWPVVPCRTEKLPDGRNIDMETFLIEVAKRLGLPGFGPKAIPAKGGGIHPLERPEDFYLRAAANVAFDGEPVPDTDDAEMALTGVDRLRPDLEQVLKPEEWRKAAYLYCRGGRFDDSDLAYDGDRLRRDYPGAMQIWNEQLARARNALTGEAFVGTATSLLPRLADGSPVDGSFNEEDWPFRVVSTKSELQSSHTIGIPSLQEIQPRNFIALNKDDADELRIVTGDAIRVVAPNGKVEGYALVRQGIARGSIGIRHGFGHKELGARPYKVADRIIAASPLAGLGVNLNDLGVVDPTVKGLSILADPVVGSIARQAIPARVERIA